MFPLIKLASQQKKLSKNNIWAGVSEKCQGNVPEALGFILITVIYVFPLLAYAMYILFPFSFLGLHMSQLQDRTSWVEHWSCMIFSYSIMFQAEFDAENDCIAEAY